ncbi:MAG: TfoX/Sxy family protein [Candidatus Moraniibacteriota bacterium]
MATSASTIEYIVDQLADVPGIRTRKMFGEYALYVGAKVVALICDDMLYVKPTPEGRAYAAGAYTEAPAYPGARLSLAMSDDFVDNRERIAELIRLTEAALPEPKPKK